MQKDPSVRLPFRPCLKARGDGTIGHCAGAGCGLLAWCHCGTCIKHHPMVACPCHAPAGCRGCQACAWTEEGGFALCRTHSPTDPYHQPQRSPVHGVPTEGAPVEVVDGERTERVLTPTDAQLKAERALGLTVTVVRLSVGVSGHRDRWRASFRNEDRSIDFHHFGTLDDVCSFVRATLGGAL